MKKKHWLEFRDYFEVVSFHLFILLFIYLIHTSIIKSILFEIINIGFCASLLLLKNFVIEQRIKRRAKKEMRIEEYKEQMQNENQDHFS